MEKILNSSGLSHFWTKLKEKFVSKTDIVDNLTSTSIDKVLSANQGKELNDSKENIANKVTAVSSSSTDQQYPSAKWTYTNLYEKTVKEYNGNFSGIAKMHRCGKLRTLEFSGLKPNNQYLFELEQTDRPTGVEMHGVVAASDGTCSVIQVNQESHSTYVQCYFYSGSKTYFGSVTYIVS